MDQYYYRQQLLTAPSLYNGLVNGEAIQNDPIAAFRAGQSWVPTTLVTGVSETPGVSQNGIEATLDALFGPAVQTAISEVQYLYDVHQPSLVPIYSYGDYDFGDTVWQSDGNDLFVGLFDPSIASNLSNSPTLAAMRTAIAESVISPSDPLGNGAAGQAGDTGAEAMFQGADDIGQAINAYGSNGQNDLSAAFSSDQQALTDMGVSYAALLGSVDEVDSQIA